MPDRRLGLAMIVYGAASLMHFAHNAMYLSAYPNMPSWLTPTGVWVSWLAQTAIGVLGYGVYRFRSRLAGTLLIAGYALLGFAGLDHYAVAPVAAHSIAMNATIVIEAATATALLAYLVLVTRVGGTRRGR
ncbi:MAG TPA: hypothetical protein VFA43_03660 [Gemmatimonadaceae bacterium]|nr:hypothetical protein [Gemmatimonadaceae bacterium]